MGIVNWVISLGWGGALGLLIVLIILAWAVGQIFKPLGYTDNKTKDGTVFRVYDNGVVHMISKGRNGVISEWELDEKGNFVDYPRND